MKLNFDEQFDVLYKYIQSKWIDDVLVRGMFRIGTLHEYRTYEQREIGDSYEGIKQYTFINSKEIMGLSSHDLQRAYPKLGLGAVNSQPLISYELANQHIPIGLEVHSPDCFVFCLTKEFDPKVMELFDCDACIEIARPKAFFTELSKGLSSVANFGVLESCYYGSRFGSYTEHNNHRPQILKDKLLEHQHEVRMLWDPKYAGQQKLPVKSSLQPKFVKRIHATRFCRRIV